MIVFILNQVSQVCMCVFVLFPHQVHVPKCFLIFLKASFFVFSTDM